MPFVDGRIVLNPWITAVPGAFRHSLKHVFGLVGWRFGIALIAHPASLPNFVVCNRLHEFVGDSHRQVSVLEHHRRIGFAVEV